MTPGDVPCVLQWIHSWLARAVTALFWGLAVTEWNDGGVWGGGGGGYRCRSCIQALRQVGSYLNKGQMLVGM